MHYTNIQITTFKKNKEKTLFNMDYEQLLEKARKELPESSLKNERFEIPNVKGHIQGNKTIVSNFLQIASILGRDPSHILKYILKELATPGEIKKSGSVIIGTKISASRINEKIKQYAKEFVFCPECNKPDTKIIKENRLIFIKCSACGAKRVVKSKI